MASDPSSDEHSYLVGMITKLLRSGMTMGDICKDLLQFHSLKAVQDARDEVDLEILRIRDLWLPGSLVNKNYESWYTGPNPDDTFWPPLKKYLLYVKGVEEGWSTDSVQSLDDCSTKIVSYLPHVGLGEFHTRGLVLGYIQSGKTSNFTGLIAKTADAGYRLFIVLSGMSNILRRQTQERLNDELRDLNTERWITLTDEDRDFGDFGVTNANAFLSKYATQKTLCVVKKNAFRMDRLLRWLSGANKHILQNCSVLVIDDEADQASINTADWREQRTRINGLLTDILSLLPKSAYVGYTATPFANVFIDPADYHGLYPKDFIIDLPKPPDYFGPETIFGRERLYDDSADDFDGLDIVRNIPDEEIADLKPKTRSDVMDFQPSITRSLRSAILYFWLATAARYARGQTGKHSSMLIHTTVYATIQGRFRQPVADFRDNIARLLADSDESLQAELAGIWKSEQERCAPSGHVEAPVDFGQVAEWLPAVLAKTNVIIENYQADLNDRLKYDSEPRVYIVVGGNVLGRGLTLKGLVVSYFIRSSNAYDTLLQMGRWFGYRSGYTDLPRIWMTEELRDFFFDLATVEQEIRNDIRLYDLEKKTPLEFSVRIRKHHVLSITSKLKMRHAVPASMSFEQTRLQTTKYNEKNADWLNANINAATGLVKAVMSDAKIQPTIIHESYNLLSAVPVKYVLEFLSKYKIQEIHEKASFPKTLVTNYIEAQNSHGSLLSWNIVVISKKNDGTGSVQFPFGTIPLINRSKMKGTGNPADIKALMSKSDIVADLDISTAELGKMNTEALFVTRQQPSYHVEDTGLLLIYPINKSSLPLKTETETREPLEALEHVIGIALVFPKARYDTPQNYMTVDLSGIDQEEIDVSEVQGAIE